MCRPNPAQRDLIGELDVSAKPTTLDFYFIAEKPVRVSGHWASQGNRRSTWCKRSKEGGERRGQTRDMWLVSCNAMHHVEVGKRPSLIMIFKNQMRYGISL